MMCKNCGESSCAGCGSKKCTSAKVSKIFLIIGGLNWGLVGLGGFLKTDLNVVHMILARAPVVEWIVYLLVGISAIALIFGCRCKTCMPAGIGEMGEKKM